MMADSASFLCDKADIIDINMGCPAPKVVKNGDGSRLLLDLDLAEEIVRRVVLASSVPVTVKFRMGWDEEHIVAVEAARRFERAGAAAITIHGRTRNQFYSGKADWNVITEVKRAVSVPVIGNGDVTCGEDAKRMFELTGVDGIMIGRASLGNPWIFGEISAYLNGDLYEVPSDEERLNVILKHYELLIEEKGEYTAVREMRKHIAWYVKGMKEAASFRSRINLVESFEDARKLLIGFFEEA